MSHPLHHAISSARQFGGVAEDYIKIHTWFDASKGALADHRHRAIRHHSEGIFWAEEVFGPYIVNTNGKKVPTRFIGEQHVKEDLGWIPTIKDWLDNMKTASWMLRPGNGRNLVREIEKEKADHIKTTIDGHT